MISPTSRDLSALALLCAAVALMFVSWACSGDSGDGSETPLPSGASGSGAVLDSLVPPLEGPVREAAPTERTDFRVLPDWQLPRPDDLPAPPPGVEGVEFSQPDEPQLLCPDGWEELKRQSESFRICYPESWAIAGHGYVSAGAEERWYSVGIVLFEGEEQVAHVSVYRFPQYARPVRHTIDCDQAYAVTFAAEPAVLCPDVSASPPEARIISYNVFLDDADYFVNVVSYEGAGEEPLAQAMEIARTFAFLQPPGG